MRTRTVAIIAAVLVAGGLAIIVDAIASGRGRTTVEPAALVPPSIAPGSTFRIAAAGDICGDCKPTSDRVIARNPNMVLTLGDNAYSDGTLAQFIANYDPNWGRFKSKTMPSPGNHDWHTSNAQGYRDYFGYGSGPLYGSFNVADWHFVRMDTTQMNSTQESWMQSDLTSDAHKCEIAYGHHPRWSSGAVHGSDDAQDAAWKIFAAQDVDVVLYGHDHEYERIVRDGIREFVVGTGGADLYSFGTVVTGSKVRILAHGILMLTLRPTSYSWRFITSDNVLLDRGSHLCT